jgi:anti-anti-sigma regulatory factor
MTLGDDRVSARPCAHAELRGDLDVYTQPRFRAVLEALEGEVVTIDMRRVRSISAAFMSEIVRLRQRLPHSRIVLAHLSDFQRRILRLAGIDAIATLG